MNPESNDLTPTSTDEQKTKRRSFVKAVRPLRSVRQRLDTDRSNGTPTRSE
ncbi:MAG: hypothetical protein AAGD35_10625 [Actinomycetota bacterium]